MRGGHLVIILSSKPLCIERKKDVERSTGLRII